MKPRIPQAAQLTDAARHLSSTSASYPILAGFDGFVDEIVHMVDSRTGPNEFTRIESMGEFARRVEAAAGLSTNIEAVPALVKLGGNGPILANALAVLGHRLTYIGNLGDGDLHPVFREFGGRCERVVSLADPAHTDALEFHDGKIMMGKMEVLNQVTWDNLVARLPVDELDAWLARGRMIACVNWTMLPFMNSILEGLADRLAATEHHARVFIDLADPSKRTPEDIRRVLSLLTSLQHHAGVILGVNEFESRQVADVLGLDPADDLEMRCAAIRDALALSVVAIHPTDCACAVDDTGTHRVNGPFTPKPRLTTGAGDVFNAGFTHGLLTGLPTTQALLAGVCASGFYVRNARPAGNDELCDFMQKWAETDCGALA